MQMSRTLSITLRIRRIVDGNRKYLRDTLQARTPPYHYRPLCRIYRKRSGTCQMIITPQSLEPAHAHVCIAAHFRIALLSKAIAYNSWRIKYQFQNVRLETSKNYILLYLYIHLRQMSWLTHWLINAQPKHLNLEIWNSRNIFLQWHKHPLRRDF